MAATPVGTLITNNDVEWIGVLHEQVPQWLKGVADETVRNRIVLANLRKKGRIKLNANSPMVIWSIKYDQSAISSTGDGGQLTFNRHDRLRQAALNWRGYVGTDAMTEKEQLINRGPGQILNRYQQVLPDLMSDINDHFNGELFGDGEASGRENNIHGLESFFATALTATAGDLVLNPSDTYAGLSTALANEGGTWTANISASNRPCQQSSYDWPVGTGNAKFDFNSPLLINWASNRWGTNSTLWENNCERAMRQAIMWQKNRCGSTGVPSVALLDVELYTGFLNHQSTKQRILIPSKSNTDMGFEGVYTFDGVALAHDYNVPNRTGYLLSYDNIELLSLQNALFASRGPEFYMINRAYLFYVGFWGNARFRPKNFAKLYPYSTVTD